MKELFDKVFNKDEDMIKEEEKKVNFLVPVAFTVRDGKVINSDTKTEDAELQALYDFLEEKLEPEEEVEDKAVGTFGI